MRTAVAPAHSEGLPPGREAFAEALIFDEVAAVWSWLGRAVPGRPDPA